VCESNLSVSHKAIFIILMMTFSGFFSGFNFFYLFFLIVETKAKRKQQDKVVTQ
jgi:hypothetical protein